MNQPISPQLSCEREQEFTDLIQEHYNYMVGCAVNLCGNKDRQINCMNYEDLLQETMLKAWKYFSGFESGTNFKGWVCRIMINIFITNARKQKVRNCIVSISEAEDRPDRDVVDPAALCQPEQLCTGFSAQIKEVLENMPEGFAEILLRVDVNREGYKDVARQLNIPIGTVMSRLYRARRKLAKATEGIWMESTGLEPNRQFLNK